MSLTHAQPVMVTGAAGFLGARIVQRLLRENIPVTAVVRRDDPGNLTRLQPCMIESPATRLCVVACNLHDRLAVQRVVDAFCPSRVVHAAWTVHPRTYRHDPDNQRWVTSSLWLARCLRQTGCRWMGALGTCIEPQVGEAPSCRYAAAKFTLRHRLRDVLEPETRVCWWRVFQPYGRGEPPTRLVPMLVEAAVSGRALRVDHPGHLRDFIHVDDIADAVCESTKHEAAGTFDVGSGIGTPLEDLARLVQMIGTDVRFAEAADCPGVERAACSDSVVADLRPLRRATGWTGPRITLPEGLASLLDEARRSVRAIA